MKNKRCNKQNCHCKCHYGIGGLHNEDECGMTVPNLKTVEEILKELLSKYNAEILNKYQDEYLMTKGPGCEELLYPVLDKAIEDFINSQNSDGIVVKFNAKDFINTHFLPKLVLVTEVEKMKITEIPEGVTGNKAPKYIRSHNHALDQVLNIINSLTK